MIGLITLLTAVLVLIAFSALAPAEDTHSPAMAEIAERAKPTPMTAAQRAKLRERAAREKERAARAAGKRGSDGKSGGKPSASASKPSRDPRHAAGGPGGASGRASPKVARAASREPVPEPDRDLDLIDETDRNDPDLVEETSVELGTTPVVGQASKVEPPSKTDADDAEEAEEEATEADGDEAEAEEEEGVDDAKSAEDEAQEVEGEVDDAKEVEEEEEEEEEKSGTKAKKVEQAEEEEDKEEEEEEEEEEGEAAVKNKPVSKAKAEQEGEDDKEEEGEEEEGEERTAVAKNTPVAKAKVAASVEDDHDKEEEEEEEEEEENKATTKTEEDEEDEDADVEDKEDDPDASDADDSTRRSTPAAIQAVAATARSRRGEAKEVCASWTGGGTPTVRKAYWINVQGSLTANEIRRAEACRLGKRDKNDKACTLRATPGEHRHNAAPSLARLDNGTVLAFWQAAEDTEGEDFQHIRMSSSRSGDGKAWQKATAAPLSPPEGVRGANPRWTPIPHVGEDGRLWLFFTESTGDRSCRLPTHPKRTWAPGGAVRVVVASPDLTRWDDPRTILPLEENGPGSAAPKTLSGRMIVTKNGEWVLPFCRDTSALARAKWPNEEKAAACGGRPPPLDETTSGCGVLASTDKGATWEARASPSLSSAKSAAAAVGAPGSGPVNTQLGDASVAEVGTGGLLLLLRSRTGGHVYQSLSSTLGRHWTTPRPVAALPNPDAKIHSARLQPSGPLAVVYNDHTKTSMTITNSGGEAGGEDGGEGGEGVKTLAVPPGCVTQLSLGFSGDNGKSWRRSLVLRGGASPGQRQSQPWMLQSGCKLIVAYSKDYAPGAKQLENDRELGIRVVHVAM